MPETGPRGEPSGVEFSSDRGLTGIFEQLAEIQKRNQTLPGTRRPGHQTPEYPPALLTEMILGLSTRQSARRSPIAEQDLLFVTSAGGLREAVAGALTAETETDVGYRRIAAEIILKEMVKAEMDHQYLAAVGPFQAGARQRGDTQLLLEDRNEPQRYQTLIDSSGWKDLQHVIVHGLKDEAARAMAQVAARPVFEQQLAEVRQKIKSLRQEQDQSKLTKKERQPLERDLQQLILTHCAYMAVAKEIGWIDLLKP